MLQDKLFEKSKGNGNIDILWNHTLKEVLGDKSGVNSVLLNNLNNKSGDVSLNVQGVFIAIGHNPNTEIFDNQIQLDDSNYIVLDKSNNRFSTQTSVQGIFAAGDVADPIYRQAVTSAGSGCMAALDAEKYLDNLD